MTRAEHQVRRTILARLGEYFRPKANGVTAPVPTSQHTAEPEAATKPEMTNRRISGAGCGVTDSPGGRAPVELQLKWLIEALQKDRERYLGMRANMLAMVAQPLTKGNPYDRPHVREAKARAAAGILGQVINGLDWLLSKHRPWNKTVNHTNNEQPKREDIRPGVG